MKIFFKNTVQPAYLEKFPVYREITFPKISWIRDWQYTIVRCNSKYIEINLVNLTLAVLKPTDNYSSYTYTVVKVKT